MKFLIANLIFYFLRCVLWFRYRITVKGLDDIVKRHPDKGILFLPNHPSFFVDPVSVGLAIWHKYPLRPLVVEYMYYLPVVNTIMRFVDALPIPNFTTSSNSLKKKKSEQVLQTVVENINHGQNFLIYPAGRTKQTAREIIGGASAIHRILQEAPETNVVLVRVKGLWGSIFSRAVTGKAPPLFPTIWQGVKYALKNLIFFSPRREVIIEFYNPPADFPYHSTRLELNRYLENWYNQPDGLTKQVGELPGDSLVLVSHSIWSCDVPVIPGEEERTREEVVSLREVPVSVQNKVLNKLGEMTDKDPATIKPLMSLSADLGLDSLDAAELIMFLQDHFDVRSVPVSELTTVSKLMAIASKQIEWKDESEDEAQIVNWQKGTKHERLTMPEGETIHEVFLRNCDRMGKAIACVDPVAGILTYPQVKMRVLLLADYIRNLPGRYVGILLPASAGATILILATQLAGKVPLMVNWTIGPRHLEAVVKLSNVQTVLTAWTFLDRLENVNLSGIEDRLLMVEDIRNSLGFKAKLKAFYRSKMNADKILNLMQDSAINRESPAVLLFTSGTESMPKGVLLTHANILSNQRATLQTVPIFTDDVFYAILPPFHSFGFTVGGIICLASGVKVAFYPDPTDGKRLAKGVDKWGITILVGAPTFIRGIMKSATPAQMKSVRLCVTGAEKPSPELKQLMDTFGKSDMLFEGYGITECAPILTFNDFTKPPKGVGHAIPGVEILIVHSETNEPLAQGEHGHILVRGPNVFSGYLNPALTPPFMEVQGKQWYKTGDMGYLDEEENLHLVGRLKRFIKVGGEMVSLASIEDALLTSLIDKEVKLNQEGPSLAICAREFTGEKPKIVLFSKIELSLEDANKMLRDAGFSNLVRLSAVVVLAEIPIMGTGKINYRVLETDYFETT